ncbi:hypothetical protein L7F22_013156 [Adiantum nelumboides]|nr:hypothetical protein [Adiantum nelumboides]
MWSSRGSDVALTAGKKSGSSPPPPSLDIAYTSTLAMVGGLHNLVSLPDYAMTTLARDSVGAGEHDRTIRWVATFQTPFGRRLVKPVDYRDAINSPQPDIWASLSDAALSG